MKNPAFQPKRPSGSAAAGAVIQQLAETLARDACDTCKSGPAMRAVALVFTLILALIANVVAPFNTASAQPAGLMDSGDLAVTGFSGTKTLGGQTFINPDGASLKVLDLSGKGAPNGKLVNAQNKFQALARDIGQVFGVALDNAPNPNIYATATSLHGLRIVIPDNNGDGIPEVVQTGQPGAAFMEGQFGVARGGGPGTVWRIDGTTGEITRFADIEPGGVKNSGAGLGNIAFDPVHYQFYVSDLDTGNIHRLDLAGNDLGSFDHGTQGRPQAGLGPVGENVGNRMNISSPAFKTGNPATWGLADERRRVWGLAYRSGRLFYAVAAGSQIWSVGINHDGSFAGDARVEIEAVKGGKPVSDILFTPQGRMIVAQRGGIQNSADYSLYHVPQQNHVLRYSRDKDGKWIQEADEYAIGFPADHRNASGGVGLACDGTLWSSGDALRNDPALAGLSPLVVHGLQGNNVSTVRPLNVPPTASWFVDFDGQFSDPEKAGHVGDVEVHRDCFGDQTGWYPIPEWTPPTGWVPPVWWPRHPDLDILKFANECKFLPVLPVTLECTYTIFVTNNGAADFVGHLNVVDNPPANAGYIAPAGGSIPWTCNQPGGIGAPISCQSDNVENLHPGETESLEVTIRIVNPDPDKLVRNCAVVDDPHDFWDNEDCDETPLPRPDLDIEKTLLNCVDEGAGKRCFFLVNFENKGGAAYNGALSFEEHFPAGTIFGIIHAATSPGWGCIGGAPVKCTLPNPPGVHMNPGDVEQLILSVIVPAGVHGNFENCVNLEPGVHNGDPVAPGLNASCAPFSVVQPIVHKCPDGWQPVPPGGAPAGWQVIAIDGINPDGTLWGMMCMRPTPQFKAGPPAPAPQPDPQPTPQCFKHETRFNKKSQVPGGWTSRKVTVGGVTIYCAAPRITTPRPQCRKGETTFTKLSLVPRGWSRRSVTSGNITIWCAKRPITVPLPQCRKGETKFTSLNLVPRGWSRRAVTLGNITIWCAKRPAVTIPLPQCRKGETKFTSSNLIPRGWSRRAVTLGKVTIWCARKPVTSNPGGGQTIIPPKPACRGGRLVLLKSLPPKWRCICPKGKSLKNGVCTGGQSNTNPGSSTINPGPSQVPQTTRPTVTPCPQGWARIRGKCVQLKLNTNPQLKKPLILKPQSQNRTLKKGKVMMFAPSTNLQAISKNRRFR